MILLASNREVSFSCEVGRLWCANEPLLARIRVAISSPEPPSPFSAQDAIVRVTRVDGELGARLYCAEVMSIANWQVPALGNLSVQKRRVAEFAALGATASEIARSLGVGDATVRSYLKDIYEALGITTRVELAGSCGRSPPTPDRRLGCAPGDLACS